MRAEAGRAGHGELKLLKYAVRVNMLLGLGDEIYFTSKAVCRFPQRKPVRANWHFGKTLPKALLLNGLQRSTPTL